MLYNKEELVNSIKQIPRFKVRDVAVKRDDDIEWFQQEQDLAVTEENSLKAIAFVKRGYNLIQFESVYIPLLDSMPDCYGEVLYDNGYSFMYVFPKTETDEQGKIGIVVVNSVNTSAGVSIRFVAMKDNRKILLPEKVAGFKKSHRTLTILDNAKDFLYNLDHIRQMWFTIVDKFTKEKLTKEWLDTSGFDKSIVTKLKKDLDEGKELNWWDAFLYAFDYVSNREYKTAVHKRKKLDKICEAVLEFGIITNI